EPQPGCGSNDRRARAGHGKRRNLRTGRRGYALCTANALIYARSHRGATGARRGVSEPAVLAWRVTLLASLAFAGNCLTLGVLSYALLGLRAEWSLTPGQAGAITVAAGAGQLVGGIVMGYAADVVGRRLAYGLTIALSALATGAAAFAPSVAWIVLLMLLA